MSGLVAEVRQQRAIVVFALAALSTWLLFESETTKNVVIWVEQTRSALMSLILLVPLAAVVGVWVGGRARALDTRELEARAVRSRVLVEFRPLLVSIATILSGYMTVLAVRWIWAALSVNGPAEVSGVDIAVPLVAMTTVAAWTLLGAAIAKTHAPRWALVPVVGLVAWLHPVLLAAPATDGLAQVTWNQWLPQGLWNPARVSTALLFAFAFLAFVAALVAVTVEPRRRTYLATAAATVGFLVAGASVVSAGPWQSLPEQDALSPLATLHCRDVGGAEVCVDPAHRTVLDDGLTDLRRQVGDRAIEGRVVRLDLGPGLQPTRLQPGVVGIGMEIGDGEMRLPEGLIPTLVGRGAPTS